MALRKKSLLLILGAFVLIIFLSVTLEGPVFHNGVPVSESLVKAEQGFSALVRRLEGLFLLQLQNTGLQEGSIQTAISLIAVPVSIAILLIMAFLILLSKAVRKEVLKRLIIAFIGAAFFVLLFYGGVFIKGGINPAVEESEWIDRVQTVIDQEATQETTNSIPQVGNSLTIIFTILIVLLIIALIYFFIRRLMQSANTPAKAPLSEMTEEALEAMEKGQDYRAIIMQYYKEMIDFLEEKKGYIRGQSLTPREFRDRLVEKGFEDKDVDRLTSLFERVRYGGQKLSPREENEASECLKTILVSLENR